MKLIDVVVGGAGFVRSAFGLVEVKKGDGLARRGAANSKESEEAWRKLGCPWFLRGSNVSRKTFGAARGFGVYHYHMKESPLGF